MWYHNFPIATKLIVAKEQKLITLESFLEHKKIDANRQKKMMFGSFS
jgi:hypothetical protein